MSIAPRKVQFRAKLEKLLDQFSNILLVTADNVGSNQMQQIRIAMRAQSPDEEPIGVLLMGKNTIIRKVLRERAQDNPKLEVLLPHLRGNLGMIFTNSDLMEVRKMVEENKVPAAARSGSIAPDDCFVPPGPTGLDPGQTNFFQALNIATKIVRGSIEIITNVHLIRKGEKVTPSHVSLLSKLNIKPFFYSMYVSKVYEDGSLYGVDVLDLTDDDLLGKFFNGVRKITALSLEIGEPNLATVPHSIGRAFKKVLALAVATDITFKEAEPFKEYLADPEAYAAKHGLAVGAPAAGGNDAAADEPEAEEEEEEESSSEEMGLGLFG